jgi:hypothetical protein
LAARDRTEPLVGEAHAKMIVPSEQRGGFALWEGFEGGFLLNDPWLHGTRLPTPTCFPGYQAAVLCERAAEWIASRPDGARPWFAVVSLESPHPPYAASADGFVPPDPVALKLASNVPSAAAAKARTELAGYYAHIAATDRAIGGLLDTLAFDETAVLITSVHGDMHGAHGLFRKGWPHEESVRVPLLVRVPGAYANTPWRGERGELVSLLDIGVWTRAWAAGDPAFVVDAAAQQLSMPSVVNLPLQCDRCWRGVRTRVRKLVVTDEVTPAGRPVTKPWLYFDLENDPSESTNLAADLHRQSEIQALKAMLKLPPAGT